ncbi:hypothetical protein BJV82DRAFT_590713 [Fennellomyces sp. T-0311]|nr:hypothetical protein BJV82DRAFT_590713 [Fennellomyces sp. T-0311]
MYVSQVPATVIYTLLKTVLLIVFAKAIASVCSWTGRYDVAKVMEQGSYTVLFSSVFTRNYRNFMTTFMAVVLFIVIAIDTVTNLLPTIATKYMPFQLVSFTYGEEKYFQAVYNTPMQSSRIPSLNYSTDNPMQAYCNDMGLCVNGEYNANELKISPTMEVKSIPYDYNTRSFITDFLNVSAPYCSIQHEGCEGGYMKFANHAEGYGPYNISSPGLPSQIYLLYDSVDESNFGISTIAEAGALRFNYRNSTGDDTSDEINTYATVRMLYRPGQTDVISVSHLSSIIYTSGRDTVIVVSKTAVHNLNPVGPTSSPNITRADIDELFKGVFNNTAALYDATFEELYPTDYGPLTTSAAFTSYVNNPYFSVDLVQRTTFEDQDTILKARILIGVFVVSDKALPIREPRYYGRDYLTNYNMTRSEFRLMSPETFSMRQPGSHDQMFDGFNDPPTEDLFMYGILNNSNQVMFGRQGYQEVVANISPAFLSILCAIILLLGVVFAIARATRNKLYFYSLYQTVGHVDESGNISDTSGVIPRISIKSRRILIGNKVLLTEDKLEQYHGEVEDR